MQIDTYPLGGVCGGVYTGVGKQSFVGNYFGNVELHVFPPLGYCLIPKCLLQYARLLCPHGRWESGIRHPGRTLGAINFEGAEKWQLAALEIAKSNVGAAKVAAALPKVTSLPTVRVIVSVEHPPRI
jgi:hypothetical protein